MSPARSGLAVAITIGAGYTACAVLFWLWPGAALNFMNGLFHGLDFGRLQGLGGGFRFSGFLYGLIGMMVWTFLLATLYAWLQDRLSRGK